MIIFAIDSGTCDSYTGNAIKKQGVKTGGDSTL
jgi:hypothetical protein